MSSDKSPRKVKKRNEIPMNEESKPLPPPDNDVQSEKFESKVDPYFRSDSKEKEAWETRRSYVKINGQWA
jgi:hypothetical protein